MRSQTFTIVIIVTIIFVAAGDAFLPQPLAKASYETRTQLNEFFLSLFPNTDLNKYKQPDRLEQFKQQNN